MFNLKYLTKYFIDNSSITNRDLEKGMFDYKSQTLCENSYNYNSINKYNCKLIIVEDSNKNDKFEKVINIV